MAPHKRTDPGKLARDREAIRKSQEAMQKPKTDFFAPLKNLDRNIKSYLGGKMKEKTERAAGYGPAPRIEGAFEKHLPASIKGEAVVGFKKRRKVVT